MDWIQRSPKYDQILIKPGESHYQFTHQIWAQSHEQFVCKYMNTSKVWWTDEPTIPFLCPLSTPLARNASQYNERGCVCLKTCNQGNLLVFKTFALHKVFKRGNFLLEQCFDCALFTWCHYHRFGSTLPNLNLTDNFWKHIYPDYYYSSSNSTPEFVSFLNCLVFQWNQVFSTHFNVNVWIQQSSASQNHRQPNLEPLWAE